MVNDVQDGGEVLRRTPKEDEDASSYIGNVGMPYSSTTIPSSVVFSITRSISKIGGEKVSQDIRCDVSVCPLADPLSGIGTY